MEQTRLPEHPDAVEEYLHLRETCDTIGREIAEVEAMTGAKAGECMDVQMEEDPDQQEEVTMQLFRAKLDRLHQLAMAREQAYFARLDFTPAGASPETYYLGRWGVLDPGTLDPVVVDWRSPAANLYYSGQIGPMDYTAPDGQIRGELMLKRMVNVRGRELLSVFDTGIVSQEAYLQQVLGSISTDRLKDIVTTIQAEQNIVIRHGLNRDLLVQGAAGSGKTTIALHRIAYLLYTFQKSLKPENMMILAPNPLFLSYISQVLPDLGVERVIQTTFERWCAEGMGKRMPKVTRESRLEKNLNLESGERERIGRLLRIRGSLAFMGRLAAWLEALQEKILPENGFRMAGVSLMTREELEDVFLRQLKYSPLETRIGELKKIIRKRVQAAAEMLKEQYAALTERQADTILGGMPEGAERQRRVKELYAVRDQRYREIDARAEAFLKQYRQKIDECQDLSPFQLELLRQAHPAATFTLVGDLYQGIRADEGIRSWEEWRSPVFGGRADFAQLTVSYRNTVEIMELARSAAGNFPVAGVGETRPVLRHGEAPEIVSVDSEKDRIRRIRDQVRRWQEEGYHSIALIEKTEEQARRLQRALGEDLGARLLTEGEPEYRGGVLVLPAGTVKGMEFDCVGICDASAEQFPREEFLCRVLYVMLTRPLHRLCIWHRGELTPLLSR